MSISYHYVKGMFHSLRILGMDVRMKPFLPLCSMPPGQSCLVTVESQM